MPCCICPWGLTVKLISLSLSQVDSKKDLEKQLKTVCEAVIMALTKLAVEPLLGFITKVTAVRVAAQSSPATAKPIREQVGGGGG
jgi:hypothetical protein